MDTVIRICDKTGNKYTGFEICKNSTINILFPQGVAVKNTFKIGIYKYTVNHIYVDGFYDGNLGNRETLDGGTNNIGTHLWVYCDTEDPRIKEGNIDEDSLQSLASDLKLI